MRRRRSRRRAPLSFSPFSGDVRGGDRRERLAPPRPILACVPSRRGSRSRNIVRAAQCLNKTARRRPRRYSIACSPSGRRPIAATTRRCRRSIARSRRPRSGPIRRRPTTSRSCPPSTNRGSFSQTDSPSGQADSTARCSMRYGPQSSRCSSARWYSARSSWITSIAMRWPIARPTPRSHRRSRRSATASRRSSLSNRSPCSSCSRSRRWPTRTTARSTTPFSNSVR